MNAREYHAMFAVEDTHWWYVGLRHLIGASIDRWRVRRPQGAWPLSVLDAGCGTGGLLAQLAPEHHRLSVGVDLFWDGLSLCRSRGLSHLLQASVTALPFKPETFDVIFSIDVLCQSGIDERRALQEVSRLLTPGGILILQLAAFQWLWSEHDAATGARRRYTKSDIERLLRQAGLTLTWSRYRNSLLFPLIAILRILKRRRVSVSDLQSDVKPVPRFLNALLTQVLILESHLLQRMRPLFGLSVFCVAQKRGPATHAG